jgi:TM2 domain-containing membrane protein YozV
MYKVVGTDGQQYGPAAADQVRRWITERRVNAHTLVQGEGAQDWRPLNTYAEFAADFAPSPPVAPAEPPRMPAVGAETRASNKVAAGVCGILLGSLGIHKFILGYTGAGLIMLLICLLTCGIAAPLTGLIGLIEGIIYLTKSDSEFVRLYVDGRREWF